MKPSKITERCEVLDLIELDALIREISPAATANDEDGSDGDAHLWEAYSRLSGEWLSGHPAATSDEIEASRRHIAKRLGL